MVSRKKCRGSCTGRFIGLVLMIFVAFALMGSLLQCAQQVPQMARNAAAQAGNGLTHAATNTVSNWGRNLLNRIEDLFKAQSPAEQFEEVCDHIPVEGVDKLCPYFTADMQGATNAQARQTSCYLTAVGKAPNGLESLKTINKTCPQTPNNAPAFQSCVENYVNNNVETGDVSSCQRSALGQFAQEVHDLIEPVACIPGLPKSWCEAKSSTQSAAPPAPTPTNPNYLACLSQYYQKLPMYNEPLTCGTSVNAEDAECVRTRLQNWVYQGQHYGVPWVQSCDALLPQSPTQ
ncbi:MAG TPA: hypothetical protein VGG63_10865 [Steroidobacteraceae bacterium]|jgi:hypothetical protein